MRPKSGRSSWTPRGAGGQREPRVQRSPLACTGGPSLESQDGVRTPSCQSSALPQGTSGKGMHGGIQAICSHRGTASFPSPPQSLPHHCPLLPWCLWGPSLNGVTAALAKTPLNSGGKPSPGISKSTGRV